MFSLGVSLQSFDYIIEVNLRTYGLAPVDDDEETGSTPAVSAPTIAVPLKPVGKTAVAPTSTSTETTPIPRGNPPYFRGFVFELSCYCFCLTYCTLP